MKRLAVLLLVIIMTINISAYTALASEDLELIINGEKQTCTLTSVFVGEENNQLLAPASELCSLLDAGYDQTGSEVTISKDAAELVFTLDSKTALVNDIAKELEAPAQLIDGEVYVPVEFCGRELGYHVLKERAGFRVRIVSKTSTTAPAVSEELIPGMAQLDSDLLKVHRPVPTEFTKPNELTVDNLIYAKTDYSDVAAYVSRPNNAMLPEGEVILSQDTFIEMMTGFDDSSIPVTITEEEVIQTKAGIKMSVSMAGQPIGGAETPAMDFDKAVRLDVNYAAPSNNLGSVPIWFENAVPSPTVRDQYILTFWARLIEGGDPDTGTGAFQIQLQSPAPNWYKTVDATPEFGTKWQRFDYLLTGYADAHNLRILPAVYEQVIEIGGFEITDVGEDADVSYFDKEEDLLAEELSPDAPWRAEALERIEEIRKGDFTVVVVDSEGNPVPDAEVTFDMFEHDFIFGIQQDTESVEDEYWDGYVRQNSEGELVHFTTNDPKPDVAGYDPTGTANGDKETELSSRRGALFNALSVGNNLKWNNYAENKYFNPDLPSAASVIIDKAQEDGLKYVRGHALWMPANATEGYPAELFAVLDDTTGTLEERYATFKKLMKEHIAQMDEEFPEIYEWDVTNETHGRTYFTNEFRSLQSGNVAEYIFKDIYDIAAEELTNGQELMLCDNRQFEEQYWDRLDLFRELGIEYDSLGMQGHSRIGSKDPENSYRPTKWLEVWDRFAYEYGKTFAVTEFSVGALNDEYGQKGQGDYMRDIMIAAFSHPACTGFNLWWMSDYWSDWNSPFATDNYQNKEDGAGVSPLYTNQFKEKPGLAIFKDLLYNKWWTKGASDTTDQNGTATVNGYYGDYDITVTVGGEKVKTEMAAFHKGYENVLTITVD